MLNNETTCKPIECLKDVLEWTGDNKRKYVVRKLNLIKKEEIEDEKDKKMKTILCHDMKNNYLEDKYIQGANSNSGYRFYNWNLIENFIYFSHHFITIPPESWINASHSNNVPMLGTLITEHTQGFNLCENLFKDKSKVDLFVSKLCDITLFYGFDGWLLNIENAIEPDRIENLIYFINKLVSQLRLIDSSRYKVIWYDSVINNGKLKWQNELNELNKCFFNQSDSVFINYTWNENNLLNCVTNSGERQNDVYVGVDVFGRNCYGGGGFSCNVAFEEISKKKLNAALFAPGWVLECNDENNFVENENKFWNLLEPYLFKRKFQELPLVSTFNQGCGEYFFINGQKIESDIGKWFNLNLQTLQPSIDNQFKWIFNDSFYGKLFIILVYVSFIL
jgi:mannosyl-glycoprotein endo-beta-N-acetylglucosaminidase